jgi:hypothetical protein
LYKLFVFLLLSFEPDKVNTTNFTDVAPNLMYSFNENRLYFARPSLKIVLLHRSLRRTGYEGHTSLFAINLTFISMSIL